MNMDKYIWLAVLPLCLVACQNDDMDANRSQENGICHLVGKMQDVVPMGRAQIQLGNTDESKETFFWNEGDKFKLYQYIDNTLIGTEFTICDDYSETANGEKTTADFTSVTPASTSASFVAVYPDNVQVDGVDAQFSLPQFIDFSSATTAEEMNEVWADYIRNHMFMIAQGTLSEEIPTVSFQHLCALARITYTNMTGSDQDISCIELSGDQVMWGGNISYNLEYGYQAGSSAGNPNQIYPQGLKVAAGETADFYIFFFPSDWEGFENGYINIGVNYRSVTLQSSEIVAANNGMKGFEAGKRYWFKVTDMGNSLMWSKNLSGEKITIDNPTFSAALKESLGDIVELDENGNAVLYKAVAESITELNLTGKSGIESLDGIEAFTNLTDLYIVGLNLKYLDISKNTKLSTVFASNNEFTTLDVSKNENLKILLLYSCPQLTELDLSNNGLLEEIKCSGCSLSSLDITKNPNLTQVECGNQQDVAALTLTMTEEQKAEWDNNWSSNSNNTNVTVVVSSN